MDIDSPKPQQMPTFASRSARPSLATRNSKKSNQHNIVSKLANSRHLSIVQHSMHNMRESSPRQQSPSLRRLGNFAKIDLSPARNRDASPSQVSSAAKDPPEPDAWGHISELDSEEDSGSDSSRPDSDEEQPAPQIDLEPRLYEDQPAGRALASGSQDGTKD